MLKLVHKKHIFKNLYNSRLTIYYSVSDIVLGIALIMLVAFFIYNYLLVNNI